MATEYGDNVVQFAASALERSAEREPIEGKYRSVHELQASFPAERESPGRARRLVVAALQQWGHEDALVDAVALLLSEMANNAVIHASSPFSIVARYQEDHKLRIAVEDWTPLATTVSTGGLIPQPTHGLSLIEALSTRWGVESTPDGKVVWAEIECPPPDAA